MNTYLSFINEYLGVEVKYVSNGPGEIRSLFHKENGDKKNLKKVWLFKKPVEILQHNRC